MIPRMSAKRPARKELHLRRIDMRGYERDDGLFEVEGRIIDTKPEDFKGWNGGRDVPANEPIHDLGVRLVFDRKMVVREVETFSTAYPFASCPGGGDALKSLAGVSMTSGWSRHVRERLAGARSCTHLMQLLMPMATVAFQTMAPLVRGEPVERDASGRPTKIDSCYAWSADRDLVRTIWPEHHRPQPEPDATKR